MEFKIDTKENYTLITPVANRLDANLAASLQEQSLDLAENGSPNLIIDLQAITQADPASFPILLDMHQETNSASRSLVFTNISEAVLQAFKSGQLHLSINLAPTMAEAVDIIHMEVLERDLFNEES